MKKIIRNYDNRTYQRISKAKAKSLLFRDDPVFIASVDMLNGNIEPANLNMPMEYTGCCKEDFDNRFDRTVRSFMQSSCSSMSEHVYFFTNLVKYTSLKHVRVKTSCYDCIYPLITVYGDSLENGRNAVLFESSDPDLVREFLNVNGIDYNKYEFLRTRVMMRDIHFSHYRAPDFMGSGKRKKKWRIAVCVPDDPHHRSHRLVTIASNADTKRECIEWLNDYYLPRNLTFEDVILYGYEFIM